METVIILLIAAVLILGAVYLVIGKRVNALASRQAVLNLQANEHSIPIQGISQPNGLNTPNSEPAQNNSDPTSAAVTAETISPITLTQPEAQASTEVNMSETNTHMASGEEVTVPRDSSKTHPTLHTHDIRFRITFPNSNVAEAVRVRTNTDPKAVLALLNIKAAAPTIFVTGGAAYMSEEDTIRTREIIESVVDFAAEHQAIVIDGGTESGVMQMVGDARRKGNYHFPLIGVSPYGKIAYPGHDNPAADAQLEDSHSHFVLVDGEDWGAESEMIVGLTKAASGFATFPAIGILINGGKIARQEVFLAVSKEIPMLILEGSGRLADEIATAFKTGKASQRILQAILGGGDIQLVSTEEGPGAMRTKLESRFVR